MFPRTDAIKMPHRHQFHQLDPCGVRDIDVKGREIGLIKILINKGFTRLKDFLPDVWQCLLTLGILIFVYEEIGQLKKCV